MTKRPWVLAFLAPALAVAQQTNPNDWDSPFPSTEAKQGPAAKPAPAPAAAPAPPPATAPAGARAQAKKELPPAPPAVNAPEDPNKRRSWPAALGSSLNPIGDGDEATVVSTQERWLAEPHSPSTWGRSFNDPKNLRLAPGAVGAMGLLRVGVADVGPVGLLRFSAQGEYFASSSFPVLNARDVRTAGEFAVSYVPLGFLEAYFAFGVAANSNTFTSPRLIQSLGDLTFGGKIAAQVAPGLHAGLDVRLLSYAGPRRFGLGLSPRALVTYDVRALAPEVPLRVHVNVGAAFDGAANVIPSSTLSAQEEFAMGIHQYNRLTAGAALEVPLPIATPFVEYTVGYPLGAGGLASPDGTPVTTAAAMPQKLGLGARLTAFRDVTLAAGAELGLTPSVALGIPATPPYNLFASASFAIDPLGPGETRVVETIRERRAEVAMPARAQTGRIEGVVIDASTKEPVSGVILAMVGANQLPVASAPDTGRFLTHELPFGPVQLQATKDGYKVAMLEVMIERPKPEPVEVSLEALAQKARFLVGVSSASKRIAASVHLEGAKDEVVQVSEAGSALLPVEVPPGAYTVTVSSAGYLSQAREVQVSQNAELELAFDLNPEPKRKLVMVKENRIEILQQVHFASGRATILSDSGPLLAEVVHAIIAGDFKKVRIEGHTDNKGNKQANLKLSADRASAVAEWLAKAGIALARLEPEGFGDSRPRAPNMTARGRELNRRVEFLILER